MTLFNGFASSGETASILVVDDGYIIAEEEGLPKERQRFFYDQPVRARQLTRVIGIQQRAGIRIGGDFDIYATCNLSPALQASSFLPYIRASKNLSLFFSCEADHNKVKVIPDSQRRQVIREDRIEDGIFAKSN